MTDLRTAAQQALAFTMRDFASLRDFEAAKAVLHDNLRAALAQQAEPVAGKVVAWGVFANIDGEWQLQHPVFAGDEQGKVNAEFERASYSGPQPLEVRPLGVVTATAQQDEPVYWEVRCTAHPKWMRVDKQQFDEYVAHGWEGQRLYTAPPQRTMVPLTEEEIYHATGHCGVSKYTAINIARVIEEASWEKNHGQA